MEIAAKALLVLVGVLHLFFLTLEMVLWTKPYGLKRFNMTPEKAEATRVLASNQGLYNGFLAAGLFWAAFSGDPSLRFFFTGCVLVAGLYGGATASKGIYYFQALPGALALIASYLAR
jgi:putative membrane protein